ncbi:hypothetical protein OG21DRAFT_1488444 [Imleria badia]|nr:hypothetical protein OG21DRAFT_1488444 [Imleria badia]
MTSSTSRCQADDVLDVLAKQKADDAAKAYLTQTFLSDELLTHVSYSKWDRGFLHQLGGLDGPETLHQIGSSLTWLSMKFNEDLPTRKSLFRRPSFIFFLLFLVIERMIAPEPVLPPSLLREKVPLLVGATILYGAGQRVHCGYDSCLPSGLHLLPDSLAISLGSLFSGWLMHRTGKYGTINLIFGILPLCGVIPLIFLHEDSGFV